MADEEGGEEEEEAAESSESIEDLFGTEQPGDAGAGAEADADAASTEGDGEPSAAAEDAPDAEAPDPDDEERNVGDQLDEAWDEGNDRAGTETADEAAEGDPQGQEPADDATDGEGDPDAEGADTGDESPDADEPSAGDSSTVTANGGAVASGIDEELLDADQRAGPPQPGGGAERLTTGIEALDHHLGGGIPPGRIVSFVATADTQSELLVKQLASQHDCLYLSTLRPKWEVQEEVTDYVQKRAGSTGGTDVRIEQLTPDSRIDAARRHVEALDRQSVVVVDAANELETSETDRYAYFIDEVKRALWDTGSVGLFYCIEEGEPPPGRAVTLRRADLVWRLRESEEVGGIRHELLVSKFRGGRALIEPLTLWLTDEVVMGER